VQLLKFAPLALAIPLALAQQPKPQLATMAAPPSDQIPAAGCTASWSGYFQHKGKKAISAELGEFVTSSINEGYVLTIHQTQSGVYVDMVCPAKTNGPERP
jgi:hypothetical protein